MDMLFVLYRARNTLLKKLVQETAFTVCSVSLTLLL